MGRPPLSIRLRTTLGAELRLRPERDRPLRGRWLRPHRRHPCVLSSRASRRWASRRNRRSDRSTLRRGPALFDERDPVFSRFLTRQRALARQRSAARGRRRLAASSPSWRGAPAGRARDRRARRPDAGRRDRGRPATTATSPSSPPGRSGSPGLAARSARGPHRSGRAVLSRPAGLRLDLNGVVKALAVDAPSLCSAATASSRPAATSPPAAPSSSRCPAGGSVALDRGGLATSGTHERRWLRGGARSTT